MWQIKRTCVILSITLLMRSASCWRYGRASYYDSIHHGSCMFGGLPNNAGWEAGALADRHPEFSGSCGACYELRCKPSVFKDGYGNTLDRTRACRGGGSVIIKVTDSCPCYYPSNHYSNKRWCCGDMDHFDISTSGFNRLADLGYGVIAVEYQRVSCPGWGMKPHGSNPGHNNLPNGGNLKGVNLELYSNFQSG